MRYLIIFPFISLLPLSVHAQDTTCQYGQITVMANDGTSVDFSNIQGAIDAAAAGDTVLVGFDDWSEKIRIHRKENITLRGLCLPIIKSVKITKSNNITVEGFKIEPKRGSAIKIWAKDTNGHGITIRNNQLVGGKHKANGIDILYARLNISIEDNEISGFGRDCVSVKLTKQSAINFKNNQISNCGHSGIHFLTRTTTTLSGNTISENGRYGLAVPKQKKRHTVAEAVTLLNNTFLNNNGRFVEDKSSNDIKNYHTIIDATDLDNVSTTRVEADGFPGSFKIDLNPCPLRGAMLVNDKGKKRRFSSIQRAINRAKNGDTVFIGSGHYDEHLLVKRKKSIVLEGKCIGSKSPLISSLTLKKSKDIEIKNIRLSGSNQNSANHVRLNLATRPRASKYGHSFNISYLE